MMFRPLTALVLASTVLSTPAWACSCFYQTVQSSWFNNTDAYAVEVLAFDVQGRNHLYAAKVKKAFNGCATQGEVIALVTADNEASCGIPLDIGRTYLLFGDRKPSVRGKLTIGVDLCEANRLASEVTAAEKAYLLSRPVTCNDTGALSCADGSAPVACPGSPCDFAAPCGDTTCVDNTCGGCTWEQYDRGGYLACEGP